MALILGRVCSIRAFQTLLASSTTGGSSVLALLAAGCSRTSSQSTHGSHDRCEAFREQHNRGIVSFSLLGCSSSGSIARLRSTHAAGAARAGASGYATASTAAGASEADEAASSSEGRSQPLWKRPVNGLPAPAPGPKGARIASRKPALKKPSRHQWFYCDVDYDPLRQPDGFRPLPPYAPEWARAKNYQQIYYKERPKHHRNKWVEAMDGTSAVGIGCQYSCFAGDCKHPIGLASYLRWPRCLSGLLPLAVRAPAMTRRQAWRP